MVFVVLVVAEHDRERPDWPVELALSEAEHRAGIDPPGEVAGDLDVGDEPFAHGVVEHVSEAGDDVGVVSSIRGQGCSVGVLEVPVGPHGDVAISGDE